jgi:hypothetical protein
MVESPKCPDCAVSMEPGFTPELAPDSGGWVYRTYWHPGTPKQNEYLFGLVTTAGVKVDERTTLSICTFRCPKCGLLRQYAGDME